MNDASLFSGIFWHNSPVVIVTSKNEEKINGQVAVTVVTSSLVPSKPRLILGIWKKNFTQQFIINSKVLNLHLLNKDQIDLVKNFGFYTGREKDKFKNIPYSNGENDCPIIEGVHSYAECRVINAMDGGDMTVFLLSVEYGDVLSDSGWMTLNDFYSTAPQQWIDYYSSKVGESIEYSLQIIDKISHEPFEP